MPRARRLLRLSSLSLAFLSLTAWLLTLRFILAGSIGSLGLVLYQGRVYGGSWPGARNLSSHSLGTWPYLFSSHPVPGTFDHHMRWGFDGYVSSGACVIYIPLWIPFLLGAIIAVLTSLRRHSCGACPACGYDITGLSGPCPECGAAVTRDCVRSP